MIVRIFGAVLCIFAILFLVALIHILMASDILEAGYKRKSRKKAQKGLKEQNVFQRLFLTELVAKAEQKLVGVYLYATLNLLQILAGIAGCGGVLLGLWIQSGRFMVIWGLGLTLAGFFVVGLVSFIPDLILLPSERKRYKTEDPAFTLAIIFGLIICPLIGWLLVKLKQ